MSIQACTAKIMPLIKVCLVLTLAVLTFNVTRADAHCVRMVNGHVMCHHHHYHHHHCWRHHHHHHHCYR